MKARFKKLFLLAIILLTPNLTHAASSCSYEEQAELNNIVANVKASYEVVDIYDGKVYDIDNPDENGVFPEVDHYVKGFNINILNITDDIYIKVVNNKNNEEKTFYYKDVQDGIATFQTKNVKELITYTIEIYANKYSCVGEKFQLLYLTTPAYNYYSGRPACENNPDFYYCQEFISSENISYTEFQKQIEEYEKQKVEKLQEEELKEKNKTFIEKIKAFYQNNKVIVYSIGVIIVVAGVATTVIFVKKKRSRVL